MKLYYSPGACSLGIHVLLEEIGKPYEAILTSLREGAQTTPEFLAINPKGKVPVLVLEDGTALTEFVAISQYLAAIHPQALLLPSDPLLAARAVEAISYINGTMHMQGFARIFRPERFSFHIEDKAEVQAIGRDIFATGFGLMERALGEKDYLLGAFSIADAALFYVEFWAKGRNALELPPGCAAHYERMLARPAVARAMAAEGLG
ncbi:MAG: glutathione S-transferase [Rhodospirillales bacterium 20-60-12]|nr:MAG: glutathione S-transferase [Rhodospirillales bacterium 20-60-12]HQT67686.1 glutathione S-transferase N-terminal domain-containing protein [Acetobacteraceae bacterium]